MMMISFIPQKISGLINSCKTVITAKFENKFIPSVVVYI